MKKLTYRQKEILTLTAHGLMNKEIAVMLGITYGTVEESLRLTRERLEAKTTTHAVAIALSNNIISMGQVSVTSQWDYDIAPVDSVMTVGSTV